MKPESRSLLIVSFLFCSIFAFPFASFAITLPIQEGIGQIDPTPSKFIYEIEGRLMAQTSEITILLEKRMAPPAELEKPETPVTGEEPSTYIESKIDAGLDFSNAEDFKEMPRTEPMERTASSSLKSTQKPETYDYDELEDPFATPGEEVPPLSDPFEGYNRFMFQVNEKIYDYFMEPLARGYRYVIPEEGRIVIGNLFDNAMAPVKLFSSLLQGDLGKSGRVVGRFLINTTAGLGGMLDVAGQEYHIDSVNEDFDQALGFYNIPTGPYIVLPFFGPSTGRGVVGRAVDAILSPTVFLGPGFLTGAGITLAENTNDVSFIIEDKKALDESAIDEYESVRDFYHQYREGLIRK